MCLKLHLPILLVTNKATAKTVAGILVDIYFPHYTWPDKILTDQGACFESRLFREILTLSNIRKLRTSSYRPTTNGQCERFNKTLLGMLGTLPQDAKKNWQKWVPTLVHAYNSTVSNVTGYSPHYLMFGQIPRLPIDIEYGVSIDEPDAVYSSFTKNLEKRFKAHDYRFGYNSMLRYVLDRFISEGSYVRYR